MDLEELVAIASKSISEDLFHIRQKDIEEELVAVSDMSTATKEHQQDSVSKLLSTSLVGDSYTAPDMRSSKKQKIRNKKAAKEKTAGAGWFDLPATTLTPEVKKDLQLLQMRNYIFKDKFYKKSDPLPKYFHVGRVVANSADFYSSRLTKKEKSETFVGELLRDSKFKQYTKKKFMVRNFLHKWPHPHRKRRNCNTKAKAAVDFPTRTELTAKLQFGKNNKEIDFSKSCE